MTELEVKTYNSLEHIGRNLWDELWSRSAVPSVFARFEWVDAWWRNFGSDKTLRIYAVSRNGALQGVLPTAWPKTHSRQPVTLVGAEHADYATILTDVAEPDAFRILIEALVSDMPRGVFVDIPDVRSDTGYFRILETLTVGVTSRWTSALEMLCPHAALDDGRAKQLADRSSLRRKARKLDKLGDVEVGHYSDAADINPWLEDFFAQHVRRWDGTKFPSLFLSTANRNFFRDLVKNFSGSGLLIFTRITVDKTPVALHCGFVSEGDFIWYKPTFNPEFSKVSPGEVMMRELFLMASDLGATGFDFTRGDEAFKTRFSNSERHVRTFTRHPSVASALRHKTIARIKDIARRNLPAFVTDFLKRQKARLDGN